jgi:hypothetical protein
MAGKNVTIGNVNISMSANAAKLIKQVDKADKFYTKKIKKMIKATKKFAKSMAVATKKMGKMSLIAGTVAVTAFAALAIQTFEAQREMQRMSDVAGVSMGQFAAMSHITKSLGLETEYLADSMKDLNVRILDAAKGGGTMVDFFALMGESATDWMDLNPADQLDKFISLTGKLSDNEAKFWADEVNDSMYRLSVTMRRSGKTMSEFQAEAKELGAGTASMFIGNINGMYESFNRLMTLVNEFKGTAFGMLASSFGSAFDSMAGKIKSFLGEGNSAGEQIFNTSKEIALYLINALKVMYEGIKTFVNKTRLLLGSLDSSFTDGLYSKEQAEKLRKLEQRIAELKFYIMDDEGFSWLNSMMGEEKQTEAVMATWKKSLVLLNEARDRLIGDSGDSAFVAQLEGISAELEASTYAAAKANAELDKNDGKKSSGADPAVLIAALDYLDDINKASTLATDSKLKEIALNKENLRALIANYKMIIANGGAEDTTFENKMAAHFALYALDDEKAAREKTLLDEKIQRERAAADKLTQIYQRGIEQRLGFDEQYGVQYQAMSAKQAELEAMRLMALREQDIITQEEHANAIKQLTQDKANAEVQMELTKLTDIANGLQGFFGESKKLAKAAFAFQQAKALQEVIVNQAKAVSSAWASELPWYAKAGAAVMAAANVGMQVQKIKNAGAGQFHDGGEIPYDGTYYMEGGEMVIPKDSVGDYIDAAGSGGGSGTVIHSNINMGSNLVDEKVLAAALSKQQTVISTLMKKEEKKRPSRNRSRNN